MTIDSGWHEVSKTFANYLIKSWLKGGDCYDITVRRSNKRGYVMIKLERPNGKKSIQPEGGA